MLNPPHNPLHNQYDAERLWEMDRDHFLHPWTHFESFERKGRWLLPRGRAVT
jgi:putrescine aminotransferase